MSAEDRSKWDAKYADQQEIATTPSRSLTALAEYLPASGRALDVAGGAGRHAIWLAKRGLDVTVTDISAVGLALARQRAADAGVNVETHRVDLERESLPPGPWDLIVCTYFIHRPLFAVFPQLLRPNGVLAVVHPTRTNLERHAKPPARFLLQDGELPQLVEGLKITHYQEGWLQEGRHEAVIVATRDCHA